MLDAKDVCIAVFLLISAMAYHSTLCCSMPIQDVKVLLFDDILACCEK
jgi:hypothetical protein